MAIDNQKQAQRQLQQITMALQRIHSGNYEICRLCEEPIALARLQVQPFVSLCISCQSARENSQD